MPAPANAGLPAPAGGFASTLWSVVLAARDRASPRAEEALAALCRTYWYPLYVYIRRQGVGADEAQDLTQEFFARLLEKDFLSAVDPDKGRFRSFLLACCQHFLSNQRDRRRAQKRGGGRPTVSIDFQTADDRYHHEPADVATPERLFERRWALTVLDQALEQVRGEYAAAGKGPLYESLKVGLVGDQEGESYAEVGRALGLTENAVKKAAQRLRQRYREVLREQIAATVDGPEQVDEEVRELFAALRA